MDKSQYLRLSLFAPLALLMLIPGYGWMILAFTGIPYLIFSSIVFLSTKHLSQPVIVKLSLVSPILFFPFIAVYWAIIFGISDYQLAHLLKSGIVLFLYTVAVGYLFVGLVHIGAWLKYEKKLSNK